jgi:hypothetical protein
VGHPDSLHWDPPVFNNPMNPLLSEQYFPLVILV